VLAVGGAWFLAETLLFAGDAALDRGEVLRRALALLPWHLALFALIGAVLAPALARRGARAGAAAWWAVWAGSTVFLAAPVAEGLAPDGGPPAAALGVAAAALGLGAILALLRGAGRFLPGFARRHWLLAASSGWIVLFVCFLRRASPVFANGMLGPGAWLDLLEPADFALAAGAMAVVLLAATALRRALFAAACLALLFATPSPGEDGRAARAASRPDVIVVLIDTYRFDHLGANVGRSDLTPNLDAFAREAIRFERGFSSSNMTSLAMPGVMASLSASVVGKRLPEESDTLAERLAQAGYATLAISTNPNVSRQFGYEQGFDVFIDPTDQADFLITSVLQAASAIAPGPAYRANIVNAALYFRPSEEVFRRGIRLLDGSPGPTLLYLHTMDLHGPYLPPRRFLPADFSTRDFYPYHRFLRLSGQGVLNSSAFAPSLRNLRQRYEGAVRYTDSEFGRLVEALRARDRWDESLVWVLSDHGECFGEHDFAGHGGPNLPGTLLRIPLLLKPPRSWGVAPRVEETPFSILDVLPTTLALLDEPLPEYIFGSERARLVREGREGAPAVVSSAVRYDGATGAVTDVYAVIEWPWKLDLVLPRGDASARETRLFHLGDDPGEAHDRAGLEPEILARLQRTLHGWRALERRHLYGPESDLLDPRVQQQLRELGYVE
jgi:arylsulfatase